MSLAIGQDVFVPGTVKKVYGQEDKPGSYAVITVGDSNIHFAADKVATAPAVVLWFFCYCDNDDGHPYKARWFDNEKAANAEHQRMCDEEDYDPGKDYQEEGDIGEVESTTVLLTAAGLLDFATSYADGE